MYKETGQCLADVAIHQSHQSMIYVPAFTYDHKSSDQKNKTDASSRNDLSLKAVWALPWRQDSV